MAVEWGCLWERNDSWWRHMGTKQKKPESWTDTKTSAGDKRKEKAEDPRNMNYIVQTLGFNEYHILIKLLDLYVGLNERTN
jgi:hypothetical protein